MNKCNLVKGKGTNLGHQMVFEKLYVTYYEILLFISDSIVFKLHLHWDMHVRSVYLALILH